MQTHRGFMEKREQPDEPLRDRACASACLRRPAHATIGVSRLIAACAIVTVFSACATVEPTVAAQPGETFSLPVGKTAAINGNGTRIRFDKVQNDSRCPTDVTCVWAGDAKIEVTIIRNGAPDETRTLGLNPPNNETTTGDLRIRLVGLMPVPRQSDTTPRAYVAQLVVDRI